MPRALQLDDLLGELITDRWIRFSGRFHPSLASAPVSAPNIAALTFELKASFARENGWTLISRRNRWFQQHAVAQLARNHKETSNGNHTVFAYSYAAAEIFKFARARGWRTVLGQIDPGPREEHRLHQTPVPKEYWESWRNECELADRVVVNSNWSKNTLLSEGVPPEKIRVIPVAYEAANGARSFRRQYPRAFSRARPLRVLFLGQISLRKGAGQLLEAVKLLSGEHVEFWFVGPVQFEVSQELRLHPQVRWFGLVPRSAVGSYYRDADVFIFPTLSDGFGLTQLEAQSWKLPVIASRYCGEVVRDGVNGVVLEEVSGAAIAAVLLRLLRSPEMLDGMAERSGVEERFSLQTLAALLREV